MLITVFRGVCLFKAKDSEILERERNKGSLHEDILTLVPGSSSNSRGSGVAVNAKSVVIAWHLTEDRACQKFFGHTGSVVAVAIIPPPLPVHTAFNSR